MIKIHVSFLLLLFHSIAIVAQDLNFKSENYTWPDENKIFEDIPDSLKNDGAVILRDDIHLDFSDGFVKRRQSVKILNLQGLAYFKSVTLPQNFDITRLNNPIYKQGRFSTRLIPYIDSYKINYFAARIIRKKTVIELPIQISTKKVYWIKPNGERIYDYEYVFNFEDLQVNDIIEYTYKSYIKGSYDTGQFYVHDYFPKLKTNLTIKLNIRPELVSKDVILNNNIDSSFFSVKKTPESSNIILYYTYNFKPLNAIKYSQNCLAGNTLPHITAKEISEINRYKFNETSLGYNYFYLSKYNWFILPDSITSTKKNIYTKNYANIRKFIAKFPDDPIDSSKNIFFSQMIDSLYNYKYLFSEQMHYSQEAQYSMSYSDRLLKRQIDEGASMSIYSNILFEKKTFYYKANIQDRRLGFHSPTYRAHKDYELEFIALPIKDFYKFYIPRYDGMKYLPDELPFYYEGTNCALFPENTKFKVNKKDLQNIRFIKTPISNHNENVRIENAIFKVNLDSSLIHTTIKENLNGQFSTILRHYYNNEYIDSTITSQYFKKCTEKPFAYNPNIKMVSLAKTFPFKASYICSENIKISRDSINLSNWFSFLFSKEKFREKITQDYYLDFTYTDTYNFLFDFNKPVTVSNINEFNKSLNNDFFEISSALNKQDENKYLLTVSTKAKQYVLPEKKANYLIEYIEILSQLNSIKLKLNY